MLDQCMACDRARIYSLESTRDPEQARYLPGHNANRAAGHEAAHSRRRDKLDDAADPEQTDTKDDEAADKGKRDCDFWTSVDAGVSFLDVLDHVGDLERHDCDGADGDVLGCGKELMTS
jgi:hypothetical protein